jgi:nonsense-mediated mRNA decay protein 3
MFCIRCGREAVKGQVLCAECIRSSGRIATVPDTVLLHICPSCGRIKKGSEWVEEEHREAAEQMLRKMVRVQGGRLKSISLNWNDEYDGYAEAELLLDVANVEKRENAQIRVNVIRNVCPTCSRKSGHYFESTLQIRGLQKEREDVLSRIIGSVEEICASRSSGQEFFISSIKRMRGGVDIEMSSSAVAAAVARELGERFGVHVLTTRSLYGRRGGKEIYRMTHLLRVAMFNEGDYVDYRGRYYRVREAGRMLVLESIIDKRRLSIRPEESRDLRYIGGKELEEWLRVTETAEGEVEVEDTGGKRRIKISPHHLYEKGSMIRVVRLREELFELP